MVEVIEGSKEGGEGGCGCIQSIIEIWSPVLHQSKEPNVSPQHC